MIRILHVVSVLDVGGMESFIMNIYRTVDRNEIQFDFLVHHARRGVFEDEIEALGGKVYHTTLIDDFNLLRYRNDLRRLFQQHPEYRVVHGHLGSTAYWYLGAAKRINGSKCILHAHTADYDKNIKGYIKNLLFKRAPINADILLACSTEAGKYTFGKRDFLLLNNGIDIRRFAFSKALRERKRRELNLTNEFVIGHAGRFIALKNQAYLLAVIEILKQQIPDVKMLFIGDGETRKSVEEEARKRNLQSNVIFAGLVKDPEAYYCAMDAFVMPSLYEGLPLTGVEAQCSNLPCIFSNNISGEVKLNSNVCFLPIGVENLAVWAEKLKNIAEQYSADRSQEMTNTLEYDIHAVADRLTEIYKKLWIEA